MNNLNFKIEKYKKDFDYSYTLGLFPTFEMIKNTDCAFLIVLSSKLTKSKDVEKLIKLAKEKKIPVEENDKLINKLSDKENCFVVGLFKKYQSKIINANKNLVLVNPSDMGNLGTIMRTTLGFGIKNLVLIEPCVDYFSPKVVRASMGAVFSLNIKKFNSVQEYLKWSKNKKFFFMLQASKVLGSFVPPKSNFDLVFGNEASGLPEYLLNEDESVIIKHNKDIDSLNLPISVGIALYEFCK